MKKFLMALTVLAMLFFGPWVNYALTKNFCMCWPDMKPEDVRIWMLGVQGIAGLLTMMWIDTSA